MGTRTLRSKVIFAGLVIGFLISAFLGIINHAIIAQAQFAGTIVELKGVGVCFECHDPELTAEFHYPDKIMAIEEKKDLRRRICIDCHGPGGNNPDKQMTDPRDIKWMEDEGYFRVTPDTIHAIHGKKLEIEALECQTCHLIKDNDPTQVGVFPVLPKPNPGQILVCQICHLPSNQGNYLAIHVISGKRECTNCHTGELKGIHKRATADLGSLSFE